MRELDVLISILDEQLKKTRDDLETLRKYTVDLFKEKMELKREIEKPCPEVWDASYHLSIAPILFYFEFLNSGSSLTRIRTKRE